MFNLTNESVDNATHNYNTIFKFKKKNICCHLRFTFKCRHLNYLIADQKQTETITFN